MLTLKNLQKEFVKSLKNSKKNKFFECIAPTVLSPEKHFLIYQSSIQGALQKALQAIYPVCLKLVGEEFFIHLINQYIKKTPSYSFDLSLYGKSFAEFIDSFQQANSIPYLSDIARLEWAWHIIDDFSTFIQSPYPLHQIWQMNQDDFVGEDKIILAADQKYFYLIWKKDSIKCMDLLSETEFNSL